MFNFLWKRLYVIFTKTLYDMITIEVNSLPVNEVMHDISKAFSTSFSESCGEYYLDIPEHIGKGNIRGIILTGALESFSTIASSTRT